MKWKDKLVEYIIEQLNVEMKLNCFAGPNVIKPTVGIHLAVFNEPFLTLLLNGEKTIESRFSIKKISPYGKVKEGDIVIIKESGGFVKGVFIAGSVKFYHNVSIQVIDQIERNYGKLICTSRDKNFWIKRSQAKYISLIEVKNIIKINPYKSEKNDRSGWSVLRVGVLENLYTEIKC